VAQVRDVPPLTWRPRTLESKERHLECGEPAKSLASIVPRLYREEEPRAVLIAWDTLEVPTYRHEEFPAYQSGREFDDALLEQLHVLPEFVAACGFQNAKAAGFEADDFLAAAAPKEEKRGGTVLIASGDRDTFQLASDRTTIHYPVRAGETARIDPAEFRARYGVDPRQVRILSPCAVIPKGRRAGAIVGAESTRRPARRACDRLGRTIGRFRS
jgi:5'-3' exonuclease